MQLTRISQDTRQERIATRAKRARTYARMTKLGLGALCMTAVWQERALYPQGHDRMQAVYTAGVAWLEEAENSGGYASAMNSFQGNGSQSEYDPITRLLLKIQR